MSRSPSICSLNSGSLRSLSTHAVSDLAVCWGQAHTQCKANQNPLCIKSFMYQIIFSTFIGFPHSMLDVDLSRWAWSLNNDFWLITLVWRSSMTSWMYNYRQLCLIDTSFSKLNILSYGLMPIYLHLKIFWWKNKEHNCNWFQKGLPITWTFTNFRNFLSFIKLWSRGELCHFLYVLL